MPACGMGLSRDGILAHCGEVAEPGLRRTPGERVFSKGNRGFKSLPLRHLLTTDGRRFLATLPMVSSGLYIRAIMTTFGHLPARPVQV